jgi:hypothetical protein
MSFREPMQPVPVSFERSAAPLPKLDECRRAMLFAGLLHVACDTCGYNESNSCRHQAGKVVIIRP